MARQNEFVAFVLEQMAAAGTVRARAMFGGYGIYDGDLMFAIVIADTLYMKADATTRPDFEARGLQPFTYTARSRSIVLTYFEAPPEVFEQPGAMRTWMRKALDAALRTAKTRDLATQAQHRRKKPARAPARRV